MFQIICPNNNVPERTYAIEVFFYDVLGCKKDALVIQLRDDAENYELIFDNYTIVIEDHFFNYYTEPLSFLKKDALPKEVLYFHAMDLELPIIYGVDRFLQDENHVTIGLDIFASTFFMLTRWEESLLGREKKGDCEESQLFCVKHGIYQRPIVNEYADLIRKVSPSNALFSTHKYEVVLSHDVDGFIAPSEWEIACDLVKQTAYSLIKGRFGGFTWREKLEYRRCYPNPNFQFKLYTELAEKYHLYEWFYFKVCGKGETEATYLYNDKRTLGIINELMEKKNPRIVLGFHPSQNVFGNYRQWEKEVRRIIELFHEKPLIGRNHHLLFNYDSLRNWEEVIGQSHNISNCVFHRRLGFRSGICVPYHLFDVYQRRTMKLIEHPCQIMDTAIRLHNYDSEEVMWNAVKTIINQVKKHSGLLVLTWHIYVRKRSIITDYYQICEKLLSCAIS